MQRAVIGCSLVLAFSAAALGADGCLDTLEEGMQLAERSGQAILYVTQWKNGV
jgi:hypothetical protein